MSSTPSSALSSPAHGVFGRRPASRISITEGISPFPPRPGSPTLSGTNGSSTFKPKLSRRWSLDNLAPNSSREGYVKDLRRQHKAAQQSKASMDEGFPFMLTEARRASNVTRNSIGGGNNFGMMASVGSGLGSGTSSGNVSQACSRPGSASPPPYQPVQNPKTIAGCKRARSFSFDEDAHMATTFVHRNPSLGSRAGIGSGLQTSSPFMTGNRFLPMGGAISTICGTAGGHGPQRLFAKNSFSSSIDISNATPVVPEDKELPPTKIAPPTRLSLGSDSLGILSESIPSECESHQSTNRISPDMPIRGVGGSVSSSNSSINSVASSGSSRNPQKCKSEAYVRKRSSSLPRILPPIFDDDVDDEVGCEFAEEGNSAGGSSCNSSQKNSWKQQNLPSHQDHTSNIIVREMQKFVCRHAIDVSQVLPLPLPTSSRQSRIMQDHGRSNSLATGATGPFAIRASGALSSPFSGFSKGKYNRAPLLSTMDCSNPALDSKHARVLMSTVAKVHAVSFAIKCKLPRLFDEIITSLDLSKRTKSASLTPSSNASPSSPSPSPTSKTFPQRPFSSSMTRKLSKTNSLEKKHHALLDEAFKLHGSPFGIDPEKAKLRMMIEQHIEELYSQTCVTPFSVLVHGNLNLNSIVFRYGHATQSQNVSGGGEGIDTIPTDVKLPSLIHACIGSPLLDIYQVLYHCTPSWQHQHPENPEKESLLFSYHSTFIEVCNQLRVKVTDFGRERLDACVEKYELAGMILAAASIGNANPSSSGSSSHIDRYQDSSNQYHSLNLSSDGTPLNISTIDEVEMTGINEDSEDDQVPLIIKKLIEAKIGDKTESNDTCDT